MAAVTLLHSRIHQPAGTRTHDLLTQGRHAGDIIPLATLTHELDGGADWRRSETGSASPSTWCTSADTDVRTSFGVQRDLHEKLRWRLTRIGELSPPPTAVPEPVAHSKTPLPPVTKRDVGWEPMFGWAN